MRAEQQRLQCAAHVACITDTHSAPAGPVGQLRWHSTPAAGGQQQQQQQQPREGGGSDSDSEAGSRLSPPQRAAALDPGWLARLPPQQLEQMARALDLDDAPQEDLKHLSRQERRQLRDMLKSMVRQATTQDTFKPGDVLAGGRYSLARILGGSVQLGWAEGMGEGRFTTLWLGQDLAAGGKEVVLKVRQ